MPSRNIVKQFAPEAYYHVYNRGLNKQAIFIDDDDYRVFLNLLKRYMNDEPAKDNYGREYPWLHEDLTLLAFCLMANHFHLLLFQRDKDAMTKLLRAVCSAYTTYFNKKYGRVGPLFQSNYKASHIIEDSYLLHISRYIHLNPQDYEHWEFSSYKFYLGKANAGWIAPKPILEMFEGDSYEMFMADYKGHKEALDEIKYELANK